MPAHHDLLILRPEGDSETPIPYPHQSAKRTNVDVEVQWYCRTH